MQYWTGLCHHVSNVHLFSPTITSLIRVILDRSLSSYVECSLILTTYYKPYPCNTGPAFVIMYRMFTYSHQLLQALSVQYWAGLCHHVLNVHLFSPPIISLIRAILGRPLSSCVECSLILTTYYKPYPCNTGPVFVIMCCMFTYSHHLL